MAKVFAILVGVAAAAGGATYALFSYAHPYRCHLSECEVASQKCCAHDTHDACTDASADAGMAVAGPVALFSDQAVSTSACCLTAGARVAPACCAAKAACADGAAGSTLAAVVGPAAAR